MPIAADENKLEESPARPAPQVASRPLELTALLGQWVNTNTPANGFRNLELTAQDEGLELHASASSGPFEGDWGTARVEAVYASDFRSPQACAFTARYDLGLAECLVQANQSLGLLIVAQLLRFKDGSGRQDYFTREFYRRTSGTLAPSKPLGFKASAARPNPVPDSPQRRGPALDASAFIGTWLNTHSATKGMARIEISDRAGTILVRIDGADENLPGDWGEQPVQTFAASLTSNVLTSFVTRRDLGIMETHLHTWVKQGVLVAARFDLRQDCSGCSNRFSREFFYRLTPSESGA